jgi:hypothetical protein
MNDNIKQLIRSKCLYQWQVAQELDCTANYFCQLLRYELSPELRQKLLDAIEKLTRKNQEVAEE